MADQGCMKAIEKLNRLTKQRPDPSDTLINIAETCQNLDISEEGWCNFYAYITCNDRENWVYKPKSDLKTMGDLTEAELKKIEEDLESQITANMEYRCYRNGIETFVDCKYVEDEKKED